MSVTNAETFVLSGGSLPSTQANVILALAAHGITATWSSPNLTITNSTLAGAEGVRLFERLIRIANANQAKLTYTAAS